MVKTITAYQGYKGKEYFCYAAVYLPQTEKCFFETEWFASPQEATFEDFKFYIPTDSDKILTKIYNDYMQLPPVDKRVPTHGA